jgi:hypothetical protein
MRKEKIMRKRLIFSAIFMLLPFAVFSQSSNWLSTINLNVSVNSTDRIDLYTDVEGNHVIVQKSNQLVYYLFNPTGTLIRSSVRDNNGFRHPMIYDPIWLATSFLQQQNH